MKFFMKQEWLKLFFLILFAVSLPAACDLDSGDGIEGTGISGSGQKGPFEPHSQVKMSFLTADTLSATHSFSTETAALGEFHLVVRRLGLARIEVTGLHRNEITGNLAKNNLTLQAIYEVRKKGNQNAYVNVMTHLVSERVIHLIRNGLAYEQARTQAENEFIVAFKPVIPVDSLPSFTQLNLYNINGTENSTGNAYLLAVSSTLLQTAMNRAQINTSSLDAELFELLNSMVSQFAADGTLPPGSFIEELQAAVAELPAQTVMDNLRKLSVDQTGAEVEVPDITIFIK